MPAQLLACFCVLHSESTFTLDDFRQNCLDATVVSWELVHHCHHLTHVILVDIYGLSVSYIINNVALATTGQVYRLDSEGEVRGTLWCTPHVIELVVHGEFIVFVGFYVRFEVVGIDVLPMQEAKDSLERLLCTAHVATDVGLSCQVSEVELFEGLSNLSWLQYSIVVSAGLR